MIGSGDGSHLLEWREIAIQGAAFWLMELVAKWILHDNARGAWPGD
jgi:hypothetical protein